MSLKPRVGPVKKQLTAVSMKLAGSPSKSESTAVGTKRKSQMTRNETVDKTYHSEMTGLTSVINETSMKLDREIDKILTNSIVATPKVHLSRTLKYWNSPKKSSPSKS
jgi:CCR4-NOT transcriptional regulation complex NOT5 subunit